MVRSSIGDQCFFNSPRIAWATEETLISISFCNHKKLIELYIPRGMQICINYGENYGATTDLSVKFLADNLGSFPNVLPNIFQPK
jgi:hypothetical protein